MRYAADIRSIIFVLLYLGSTVAAWLLHPYLNYRQIGSFMCFIGVLSFCCAIIVHNTIHSPVFRSRNMNRLFQIVLSLCYGHMVSAFVPGHNFSHHRGIQSNKDIMRTTKARFRWNLLNQLFFFFIMSGAITNSEIRYVKVMRKEKPVWFHQYLLEGFIVFSLKIALVILDWQRASLYILIPHLYAVWGIVSTNYWQHDGTDQFHKYNHSRNFTSKVLNYATFNNGYHGLHHMRPGLHWSLLPVMHKRVLHGHVDPRLEQSSLFLYLCKTCIWPGKRLTYDGKPIAKPSKSVDEDWVSDLMIRKEGVSLGAET